MKTISSLLLLFLFRLLFVDVFERLLGSIVEEDEEEETDLETFEVAAAVLVTRLVIWWYFKMSVYDDGEAVIFLFLKSSLYLFIFCCLKNVFSTTHKFHKIRKEKYKFFVFYYNQMKVNFGFNLFFYHFLHSFVYLFFLCVCVATSHVSILT